MWADFWFPHDCWKSQCGQTWTSNAEGRKRGRGPWAWDGSGTRRADCRPSRPAGIPRVLQQRSNTLHPPAPPEALYPPSPVLSVTDNSTVWHFLKAVSATAVGEAMAASVTPGRPERLSEESVAFTTFSFTAVSPTITSRSLEVEVAGARTPIRLATAAKCAFSEKNKENN